MISKLLLILHVLLFISELIESDDHYKGEHFPVKYLEIDSNIPEYSDVEYYLSGLSKLLNYLETKSNETDGNSALGIFYMKAILKRTIKDNKDKIQEKDRKLINHILRQADNVMSHYFYKIRSHDWSSMLRRLSELFKEEEMLIDSMENYNKNRLHKWILSSENEVNPFADLMDEIKMSKNMYMELSEMSMIPEGDYIMDVSVSDGCLAEVIYTPTPRSKELQPCVANFRCVLVLYQHPSVSYRLSHRLLNLMLPRQVRRCYMLTAKEDETLMDQLCASMYREVVYLARRGYFNRDMFMENVGLCACLGYEEFHRRHWFHKVMSWIDHQGCIQENFNYNANRTRFFSEYKHDGDEKQKILRKLRELLKSPCHRHQMALSLIVLAHGVRHAVQFSKESLGIKDEL